MNQPRRLLLLGHTEQRKSAARQRAVALAAVGATPLHITVLVEPLMTYSLLDNDARHSRPRVVVATVELTDPQTRHSGLNDQIIAAGIALATQCGASFQLIHVHGNMPAYQASTGEATADWAEVAEALRLAQQQSFASLAERHDIPQGLRQFILGQPSSGIIDFALAHHADVVVMGRVHRNVPDKWLGSTTETVLQRLSGSVLAICPEAAG